MRSHINSNSPVPVRLQLRSILVEHIEQGVYKPGVKLPSERALAEKFGVSRTSVREIITQLLSEGILFRTGGRGTCVSEKGVKLVRAQEPSRQIGFWIDASIFNFVQPGYTQILTGAGEVCRNRDYRLQFHAVEESTQPLDLVFGEAGSSGGLDGNLVVGGVHRGVLERLRQSGSPLLLVDSLVEGGEADSVRIDYATGTRQAIEHLTALGHQQIGFVGFAESQKYEAFWQSLDACGVPYQPRLVRFLSPTDLRPGMLAGYQSAQKLIAGRRLPTALLVTNDYVALGVLEALVIAGVRVPEEVSVVGCDDLGLSAQPLTTIHVDLMEVGRVAANALVNRIETGIQPEGELLVPVRLAVRGTTAPPVRAEVLANIGTAGGD